MLKSLKKILKQYFLFVIAVFGLIVCVILKYAGQLSIARWLAAVVSLIEIMPIFWAIYNDFKLGYYGVNIITPASVITALLIRQFRVGLAIVICYSGLITYNFYLKSKARSELDRLAVKVPYEVKVLKGKKEQIVPFSKLTKSSTFKVETGEVVPADCELITSSCKVNEYNLTGSNEQVAKSSGELIMSGSIVDQPIVAKAINSSLDSTFIRLLKLADNAVSSDSNFARRINLLNIPYTIILLAVGVFTWLNTHNSIRLLEVLSIGLPYIFIGLAPVTLISGLIKNLKQGIYVRGESTLKKYASFKTIIFDESTSLSDGKPYIDGIVTFRGLRQTELLALAAGLARNLKSPVYQTVIDYALTKKTKFQKLARVTWRDNIVSGFANKHEYLICNSENLNKLKVEVPKGVKINDGHLKLFVARDRDLIGIINFSSELRADAKSFINALRKLKIKNIRLISNQSSAIVSSIAKQVSLKSDELVSNIKDSDKLIYIEQIKDRPSAYLSNNSQDVHMLTAADLGIAINVKQDFGLEEPASVLILDNDLKKVSLGVKISKQTFNLSKQNIFASIIIGLLLVAILSLGHMKPIYGVLFQAGIGLLVITSSLRLYFKDN